MITLSIMADHCYAECRYAECHYAECRGASSTALLHWFLLNKMELDGAENS
jgi:hypothetical protein